MFNSRNPVYKNPVGAVESGANIHFKINLPRDLHCSAATLRITEDGGGSTYAYGMFWCGMDGSHAEWWECDFSPEAPGLYFYDFSLITWRGTLRLGRGFEGEGDFSARDRWQLTVYTPGGKIPEWLAGGLMYQIFPDRFYKSGKPKMGVPEDRKIHENWCEQPDWAPNQEGKITNSDYFGGDLAGITQKLSYLQSLGVTCIYLNPIFESHSNHRYDTADYSKIDPLLGDEEDFRRLCEEGKKRGIRVMLDGVFNHTGSDSVYFNRQGRYPGPGAYNSQSSPYYPWYSFQHWPDQYDCWWDFITLPNVRETNPDYNEYINGKNGIVRKWLNAGAAAWRLDVADELPDQFIDALVRAAKEEKSDALVLGEVWEDASNKCAYGVRRRYLLGGQLDSVMNYPFRNAILGFLTGMNPAHAMEIVLTVLENYPPKVIQLLMNHIGTHDTERALTVLAGEPLGSNDRAWQSRTHLTKDCRRHGTELLRLASLMQYTLPGVPCVYYGDEAGMEGYRDPFNRGCYPWGGEDAELLGWYRRLGQLRQMLQDPLKEGGLEPVWAKDDCLAYIRKGKKKSIFVAVNRSGQERALTVPAEWADAESLLGASPMGDSLKLAPCGYTLLVKKHSDEEISSS